MNKRLQDHSNLSKKIFSFKFREPEPQILDYKAQQNKLFPALAASFAFHFAAENLWNLYHVATENIGKGDLQMLPDVSYTS